MKPPRFFLSFVVLFWGWQVQLFWIALILAVLFEFAHKTKSKFELKPSDFNKFVDISTILLAGTIIIALTIEAEKAIFVLIKWLPLIFLPIMAAQEFSVNNEIDIQSFFLVARKKVKLRFYETRAINVSYIYSLFCILSAGTANIKGELYYFSVVLFFAWALWQVRSRRSSIYLWVIIMLVVIMAGVAGHKTIRMASREFTHWMMEYYANYYHTNPFKGFTSLGEIGDFKLSDKIVLRVLAHEYSPGKSYLLHRATYNRFYISNWFAKSGFEPVKPGKDDTFWQINPPGKIVENMTIYFRPVKKRAVLSLPPGTVAISEMKAGAMEKSELQVIRIDDGPALIKGVVSFTGQLSYDAAPYDHDLLIPEKELPGIEKIAWDLGLGNKSETQVLETLKHYFSTQYTYSLDLKGKGKYETPLQNFFNQTRAGHCEFFATATALLLRQAKIPTRYATGFIAHEYSELENKLIVRQRDAHAWVKVYINGQWRNFDTTPPEFLQIDRQNAEISPLTDLFSFLGFKLSQIRHETGAELMDQYGFWLVLPLVVILFFRLRKSNKIKRVKMADRPKEDKIKENHGISFVLIEELLSQNGFPRYRYETYGSWIERIGHHFENKGVTLDLQRLLQLHNRHRFSQTGLKKNEKIKFESGIKKILNVFPA